MLELLQNPEILLQGEPYILTDALYFYQPPTLVFMFVYFLYYFEVLE